MIENIAEAPPLFPSATLLPILSWLQGGLLVRCTADVKTGAGNRTKQGKEERWLPPFQLRTAKVQCNFPFAKYFNFLFCTVLPATFLTLHYPGGNFHILLLATVPI